MIEGLLFRGGRAARVVRAQIEVDASLDHAWEDRCREAGFQVESENEAWSVRVIAEDPPGADDAMLLRIFGHKCRPEKETLSAHWRISIAPRPSSDPPSGIASKIAEDTSKFGGGAGWLSALARVWPEPNTVRWSFEIDYALDREKWEPFFGGNRLFGKAVSDSVTFWTDYVGWKALGHPRVRDVVLIPEGESGSLTALSVRGEIDLAIGSTMLRELDKVSWEDILPLLTPSRQS